MRFSESIFAARFRITGQDLEAYLAEALSQGGDYADLYFEYLVTSSIGIDESMVKSAAAGRFAWASGVRVIAGERTGYAYSDDLAPEKIRKAARVAACIAAGPGQGGQVRPSAKAQRHNLYPVLTAPTETAFAERVELVKRADRAARAYDPRIFQVQATYADNLRQVLVATSDGVLTLRPPAAGAPQRVGPGARERRHAAARPRRRRRTRGAGFLPQREDARALRPRGRARSRGHARRRGRAGRRDDRGAGSRLARHSAARSRGPRPGGRFQPQGRLGLQRPHGPEGGQRAVHRGRRWHHRQPPRLAQRGRRRPPHRSATC